MESTSENKSSDVNPEGQQQTSVNETAGPPVMTMLHDDVKEIIESYVQQQGYNDVTMKVEVGSNLGDNYMGFIGKLTITAIDHNNEKKTLNWIVKTAPNIEMYRIAMDIASVYHRESYMYSEVLKLFRNFQSEKHALEPFDQYPQFIMSCEDYMKESIVMENMKSIGYIMRPRQETLDLNHVKLAIKAYAKFHAVSYALKDQKPDVFKEIAENMKDIVMDKLLNEHVQEAQRPLMLKTLAVVDTIPDIKTKSLFKKFMDNYGDILKKLIMDTNERSVIGHGDCWVNNMLWKYDIPDSNIPSKVCLLDWQQARYGSPAFDLSYFLFTCTNKIFRDKHYDDMIKLYYYTLCAHVNELGTDPQKYLTFEALKEELKKYSLLGMFTSIFLIFLMTADVAEMTEWRAEDTKYEELQEQLIRANQQSNTYSKRLTDVIIDCYEKGYLDNLI